MANFFKFLTLSLYFIFNLKAVEKPLVYGVLENQLGNNLFQIAATSAHAWNYGAEPCFPDLALKKKNNMPLNYKHVFFRCNAGPKKRVSTIWRAPSTANFCYTQIPYKPNMQIVGNFQSELYFNNWRERLIELFAPSAEDLNYIQEKYGDLLKQPNTVGIQMRWFGLKHDAPWWQFLWQYGYDFFEKAADLFPEDSVFIVTSNSEEFVKTNLPPLKNVIILKNEPYYIEFFIMTLCQHNIISNSTFGWWAAWLNQNPKKIVVCPKLWVQDNPSHGPIEVWPDSWIKIKAYCEMPTGLMKKI